MVDTMKVRLEAHSICQFMKNKFHDPWFPEVSRLIGTNSLEYHCFEKQIIIAYVTWDSERHLLQQTCEIHVRRSNCTLIKSRQMMKNQRRIWFMTMTKKINLFSHRLKKVKYLAHQGKIFIYYAFHINHYSTTEFHVYCLYPKGTFLFSELHSTHRKRTASMLNKGKHVPNQVRVATQ